MIVAGGFIDFPKIGNLWSWRGVRNNGIIRCMLDKAYGNGDWHAALPKSELEYLEMIGSDHIPILDRFTTQTTQRSKMFTFDKRQLFLPRGLS